MFKVGDIVVHKTNPGLKMVLTVVETFPGENISDEFSVCFWNEGKSEFQTERFLGKEIDKYV